MILVVNAKGRLASFDCAFIAAPNTNIRTQDSANNAPILSISTIILDKTSLIPNQIGKKMHTFEHDPAMVWEYRELAGFKSERRKRLESRGTIRSKCYSFNVGRSHNRNGGEGVNRCHWNSTRGRLARYETMTLQINLFSSRRREGGSLSPEIRPT